MTVRVPGRLHGRVSAAIGGEVDVRGLRVRVGDEVVVHARSGPQPAQVVAVRPDSARALMYTSSDGIGRGDLVERADGNDDVTVSWNLLGRVLGALGEPRDNLGEIDGQRVPVAAQILNPLERKRIEEPLPTGVRVIDSLCTLGRGQRIGIFAGSGVGKSTLLAMIARGTAADVVVVCMVGERGREVREFIEDTLGPEGLARSVVVVATSDEPPLMRRQAPLTATRIAEWFADQGQDVLLLMDSLTRMSMAQREIGMAAGEPPTARGYTPSVFTLMPQLLERAGTRATGSITGIYTVLTEGTDVDADPIADAARSILDGHIHLDRELLHKGRYPSVDPLPSISRLATTVTSAEQQAQAGRLRALMSALESIRDLVDVGAYQPGANPLADEALAKEAAIENFLTQPMDNVTSYDDTWRGLSAAIDDGINDELIDLDADLAEAARPAAAESHELAAHPTDVEVSA